MTDRELMQQALEALEWVADERVSAYDNQLGAAILALRERLAREEQEPVAWELRKGKTDRVLVEITNNPKRAHDWKCSLEEVVPLYTAPQPACPYIRSSKEGTHWCALAEQPRTDVDS